MRSNKFQLLLFCKSWGNVNHHNYRCVLLNLCLTMAFPLQNYNENEICIYSANCFTIPADGSENVALDSVSFWGPSIRFPPLREKQKFTPKCPHKSNDICVLIVLELVQKKGSRSRDWGTERVLVIPSFYIVLPLGQMHYRKLFTLNNRPKHYPSPFRSHYSHNTNEQTVIRQTGGLAPGLSRHTADQIVSMEAGGQDMVICESI